MRFQCALLCSICLLLTSNSSLFGLLAANARRLKQQAATSESPAQAAVYPNFCWFDGLKRRILFEYASSDPTIEDLVARHEHAKLVAKDDTSAVELHKQLYKRIFEFELREQPASTEFRHECNSFSVASSSLSPGGQSREEALHECKQLHAAFKLYDLWTNTPYDFLKYSEMNLARLKTKRRNKLNKRKRRIAQQTHDVQTLRGYLEASLVRARIEFWTFCNRTPQECRRVLLPLAHSAATGSLGPTQLASVSMNIEELIRCFKADLLATRLIASGAVDAATVRQFAAKPAHTFNVHLDADFSAQQTTVAQRQQQQNLVGFDKTSYANLVAFLRWLDEQQPLDVTYDYLFNSLGLIGSEPLFAKLQLYYRSQVEKLLIS